MEATVRNRNLLLTAALAALVGCYVEVPDEVIEGVAVITRRDPGAEFASFQTFHINPEWRVLDGDDDYTEDMPDAIRTAIQQNLLDRGYGEDPALDPGVTDLGVQVTGVIGQITVYYPGYWCDPYYYYSCWYWGWGAVDSYEVGTLIIELIDLNGTPVNGYLPVAWAGLEYGVLFGYGSYDIPRAVEGIDRAFAQSPYIQAAP
jgi:hypothetical protein